jgi:hypothetical protein
MSKANSRVEAFKYVDRAIRLQLSEDAALSEVEECLNEALKLDPDSVEALQEAGSGLVEVGGRQNPLRHQRRSKQQDATQPQFNPS